MEKAIVDAFEGVKALYLTTYNEDISNDFINNIQPYMNSSNIEKITIWKYIIEKLMIIIKKQNNEIYSFFLTAIQEILSIAEELKLNYSTNTEIIEQLKLENQDLTFVNNELTINIEQLQAENKEYLEKLNTHSKLSVNTSTSNFLSSPTLKAVISPTTPKETISPITPKETISPITPKEIINPAVIKEIISPTTIKEIISPTTIKEILPLQSTKKQAMKSRVSNSRELTLKQLKDSIEDIYSNKVKFDEKCLENKQPRETMDQFLYTYLNQKYGLKTLISEWSVLILKAIERYESVDSEVLLFSKILNHRIDEDYRQVFDKLKDNMKQLLKAKIQQRNSYIREIQLNALLKEKLNGVLDEDEWGTIIVSMFSQGEAEYVIGHIKNLIEEKCSKLIIGRRSKQFNGKSDASYAEVQNAILNYDLSAHEALLQPFWKEFLAYDKDQNGLLSQEEFKNLCNSIGILDDAERLLEYVDPNATGYINFSDCVNLFTYEMIQSEDGSQVSILHALFFQSQNISN